MFCYIGSTSIPGFGFTTHYDFHYQLSTPSINRDSKSQLPSPGWQSLRKRNPGAADAQGVPGVVDASGFRHRRLGRQIVLGARSLPPNTTLFVLLPWPYVVASSGYDPSFFQELSSTRLADCIHSIFTYSVQRESRIGVQIKTGGVDHTFLDPTTPDQTDQSESLPGFLTPQQPFRSTFYPFTLLVRPITSRKPYIDIVVGHGTAIAETEADLVQFGQLVSDQKAIEAKANQQAISYREMGFASSAVCMPSRQLRVGIRNRNDRNDHDHSMVSNRTFSILA